MDVCELIGSAQQILRQPDTKLPHLTVISADQPSRIDAVVYNPVVCLILQGAKETGTDDRMTVLRAGDALVVSHDVPVRSRITRASPAQPYLAAILSLDLGLLRSLYEQVGDHVPGASAQRALCSGKAGPELVDPVARYLALQDRPLDAAVLGPAILREIHFRLLMSPIGGMLRRLLSVDSHASRISRAIQKIRHGFRAPLAVADLARTAGMSQSSFHGHFKQVTGTTPLQYQKDLRMIEARALLRGGQHSVSAVSFEVGYESPTHFSRDYHRKFGVAPSKEAPVPVPA